MADCRLGLVALGDSITVGEGSMALGITPLSWAQWLAKALDLPFTSYAVNGAYTADVLALQLPRVRARQPLRPGQRRDAERHRALADRDAVAERDEAQARLAGRAHRALRPAIIRL